ncbi:Alpha/Beta hydrolase protein [Rhexocercosporidium sp. MPI-PUGE-AT-0058]|nr:Alpha/Beta hydrolase protein [Rhexocercosporidium sp. MPI-PUGE-AT-0058]
MALDTPTGDEDVFILAKHTRVHGLQRHGIASFRGIQYGTISQRFGEAKYKPLSDSSSLIDATAFGPHCPQPSDPQHDGLKHLLAELEKPVGIVSEFDCLRVNVYTPSTSWGQEKKLPVLVWIHGGALVTGSGDEETGGADLVQKALELGKPFVYVTLNYRLGLFGFSHSIELEQEAKEHREGGFANQGLLDQRLAMRWVKENIHYFGGDTSEITLAGESAGAVCILAHLRSDVLICKRAIIMSPPRWPMQSLAKSQAIFDDVYKATSLREDQLGSDKLERIRNLTAEQLVALAPPFLGFTWDPKWFAEADIGKPLDEMSAIPPWLDGLVIGSTKDEIAAWGLPSKGYTRHEQTNILNTIIPHSDFRREIIEEYDISTLSDSSLLPSLIQIGTESLFTSLALDIAKSLRVPTSLYVFDHKDSFPESSLKGYAYHAFDNCFFARFPSVAGPDATLEMRATADLTTSWVSMFVHGEQPWEVWDEDIGRGMVVGESVKQDDEVERGGGLGGVISIVRKLEGLERIGRMTSTSERKRMFEAAGHKLLSF